jgi:tRNA dimethylallyltransferase
MRSLSPGEIGKRRLVAIVGPTAVGKTDLSIELAKSYGGEIVNADSRQIYRGMDIGTAKPTAQQREVVPHHLYDIVDPSERYSLNLYRRDAREALEGIWKRKCLPFVVGGTGQYIWALLENWTVPEVAPDEVLRNELRLYAEQSGVQKLHDRLRDVDPESANKIHPRNVRRVIRALEVHTHTGRPISGWQAKGQPDFLYSVIGLDLPDAIDGSMNRAKSSEHITRINRRTEKIFEDGLLEETKNLLATGVSPDASALTSIGYREAVSVLHGEASKEKAIELTKRSTKRLVRRQHQWFRREDKRIIWVSNLADAMTAMESMILH